MSHDEADLMLQLRAVNARSRELQEQLDSNGEERALLARQILIRFILPSATWRVTYNGDLLAVQDLGPGRRSLGARVLELFGSNFHQKRFVLSEEPKKADAELKDLVGWLQDRGVLAADQDLDALLLAFSAHYDGTNDVWMDRVCAHVDDDNLWLRCGDIPTLLAFVEEHRLEVKWDNVVDLVEEADRVAARAAAHAAQLRSRLERFLT